SERRGSTSALELLRWSAVITEVRIDEHRTPQPAGRAVSTLEETNHHDRGQPSFGASDRLPRLDGAGRADGRNSGAQAQESYRTSAAPARAHRCSGAGRVMKAASATASAIRGRTRVPQPHPISQTSCSYNPIT